MGVEIGVAGKFRGTGKYYIACEWDPTLYDSKDDATLAVILHGDGPCETEREFMAYEEARGDRNEWFATHLHVGWDNEFDMGDYYDSTCYRTSTAMRTANQYMIDYYKGEPSSWTTHPHLIVQERMDTKWDRYDVRMSNGNAVSVLMTAGFQLDDEEAPFFVYHGECTGEELMDRLVLASALPKEDGEIPSMTFVEEGKATLITGRREEGYIDTRLTWMRDLAQVAIDNNVTLSWC